MIWVFLDVGPGVIYIQYVFTSDYENRKSSA